MVVFRFIFYCYASCGSQRQAVRKQATCQTRLQFRELSIQQEHSSVGVGTEGGVHMGMPRVRWMPVSDYSYTWIIRLS